MSANDNGTLRKGEGIFIYGTLVLLTIVEAGIVLAGVPKFMGAVLMALTTLFKVGMIGLFFMHLKFDRRIAWLLPAIPVALAIIFVLMLFPDIVYHLPLKFR